MATQTSIPTNADNPIDPRSRATRFALIEKAEALFAEKGIDSVSLRQIGNAIGAGNSNVVTYHFGSKDALVVAIFHDRLAWVEGRRGEILRRSETEGVATELDVLVRSYWQPFFELTNSAGNHAYAGLMLSLYRSSRNKIREELLRSYKNFDYPNTIHIQERMRTQLDYHSTPVFERRMRVGNSIIHEHLRMIDEQKPLKSEDDGPAVFADALSLVSRMLAEPAADS